MAVCAVTLMNPRAKYGRQHVLPRNGVWAASQRFTRPGRMRDLEAGTRWQGFRQCLQGAAECVETPSKGCALALRHVNRPRIEGVYRRSDVFASAAGSLCGSGSTSCGATASTRHCDLAWFAVCSGRGTLDQGVGCGLSRTSGACWWVPVPRGQGCEALFSERVAVRKIDWRRGEAGVYRIPAFKRTPWRGVDWLIGCRTGVGGSGAWLYR